MKHEDTIDDSLYSRMRYVMGDDALLRLQGSSVFLSGLGGLGVEIAKNVALAGVKLFVLHDTKHTEMSDLASQFYLKEDDIGKNRLLCSVDQIKELNPYVKILTSVEDLSTIDLSFFDQFKCVVLTDTPREIQLRINEYCHSKNICFISCAVNGVFAWEFADFGTDFEILDVDGENRPDVIIEDVTKAEEGVVTVVKAYGHNFEEGQTITFREVKGMTQLNGNNFKITKKLTTNTFTIGDTSSFSDYEGGGIASYVKEVKKESWLPLKESLAEPEFLMIDFARWGIEKQQHIAFLALDAFQAKNKRLPEAWDAKDAEELVELAKKEAEKASEKFKVETLDEDLVKKLAFTSRGCLSPITGFLGGVIAQEVLKAVSGKFTPLRQWMYYDAIEVLPEVESMKDFKVAGSRYDAFNICVGQALLDKLANLKIFMIGVGAIGCELLKNYAMMGLATDKGTITITDDDNIESSNLNRQFLFRKPDIGKPKSTSAANAVKKMNSKLRITAKLNRVGEATEDIYSDTFFESLDVVVNALDNVQARLYVDQRCVANQKPLLESGTLAAKGHTQVVVPFKTESYGSQRDPPEKEVPFCTLKSFPHKIEHCIEWARDLVFEDHFANTPMEWNKFFEKGTVGLIDRLKEGGASNYGALKRVLSLVDFSPKNFDDCITKARKEFQKYFYNDAKQLLHNFPLDHKMGDGKLFWSNPKRPPTPVVFDSSDKAHLEFIAAYANLLAVEWGLEGTTDLAKIAEVAAKVEVPEWKPTKAEIVTDEKASKEEVEKKEDKVDEGEYDSMLNKLADYLKDNKPPQLVMADFEKDDDTNFHIDCIHATSNLRGRMYKIDEVARVETKRIAGRIVPAIATTTAAVSGLIMVELIKLAKGCPVEQMKNAFINLALPLFAFSEPGPCDKIPIAGELSYTLWDRWDIKLGNPTVEKFLDYFKVKYGFTATSVMQGGTMIYSDMFDDMEDRLKKKLTKLLSFAKDAKHVDLILAFEADGEEVSTPPVRFILPKRKKKTQK